MNSGGSGVRQRRGTQGRGVIGVFRRAGRRVDHAVHVLPLLAQLAVTVVHVDNLVLDVAGILGTAGHVAVAGYLRHAAQIVITVRNGLHRIVHARSRRRHLLGRLPAGSVVKIGQDSSRLPAVLLIGAGLDRAIGIVGEGKADPPPRISFGIIPLAKPMRVPPTSLG